jgi:hypothetical protein
LSLIPLPYIPKSCFFISFSLSKIIYHSSFRITSFSFPIQTYASFLPSSFFLPPFSPIPHSMYSFISPFLFLPHFFYSPHQSFFS